MLTVDRKAGVAVVTVGRAGGAFPGITYMSGDLKLRLVATADLVSAAEVISGTIDDVTPGMELSIEEKRSNKFIIPR
ncbi:MAG: hypothetical protein MJ025_05445 [Victivallaceae bacterium]|nr:hypothetical protein [Victivallaceae bacterium]